MRKLASIQRIWKIEPIEGADKIELAHVLGWQCVVKKGEFKKGDFGIYFEVDSFLPIKPEFEFLRNSSYKKSELMGEGFKLRTQKIRGEISQGLLLPIDILPFEVELGDDVTEILGVRKWEIEERATTGGTVIGTLPQDIPHTDEVRIQSEPRLIESFRNLEYYISTKMDGSSHSISIDSNGFHVTGHNYEYKDDGKCSFYNLVKERVYESLMQEYMDAEDISTLTIQGEFCAPGIQKNRLGLAKPEWYVFTIRVNGRRVGLNEMMAIAERIGLTLVPIEELGYDLPSIYPTVDCLLNRAEGEYPNGGQKEGVVIRPIEPIWSNLINAELSMKAINNQYLLKAKS